MVTSSLQPLFWGFWQNGQTFSCQKPLLTWSSVNAAKFFWPIGDSINRVPLYLGLLTQLENFVTDKWSESAANHTVTNKNLLQWLQKRIVKQSLIILPVYEGISLWMCSKVQWKSFQSLTPHNLQEAPGKKIISIIADLIHYCYHYYYFSIFYFIIWLQ